LFDVSIKNEWNKLLEKTIKSREDPKPFSQQFHLITTIDFKFDSPFDVKLSQNFILVSDYASGHIHVFDSHSKEYVTSLECPLPRYMLIEMNHCTKVEYLIFSCDDDHVYKVDLMKSIYRAKNNLPLNYIWTFGDGCDLVNGLAISYSNKYLNNDNALFVCDSYNNRVLILNARTGTCIGEIIEYTTVKCKTLRV